MTPALVGTQLGDFEIVRELGRGGMGVVYEARQVSLNRRVALKVLAGGLGLSAQAVDRFRREAEAAARLHHTNIVPVYATGEAGGTHYYAMELVDGPSLDAIVRQRRGDPVALPAELAATGPFVGGLAPRLGSGPAPSGLSSGQAYFDTVARLIADLADALHHAHQEGILHRDVKPANVLLSAGGRPSLTDFGLARLLEQPGLTITGEFVGTPAYMSPEQVTAGRVRVDHRTDIYSLGATLYELLTLRPPFAADSRDRLLGMVVQKEPAPPRRVNPKVPRDLETICLKCLEKDPDRRYPTAEALAADLRRFVNRFAVLARRPGPLTRLAKRVRRNPALAGLAAGLIVAVAVAAVLAYRSYRAEQNRIADEQRREAERVAERRRAAIERGMVAALAADFVAAEAAVADAEGLGAAPDETDLLRGFIDTYRGDTDRAIATLERVVAARPNSFQARAMLCNACLDDRSQICAQEALDALTGVPVTSPEDKLYLGVVVNKVRPAEGVAMMDEAMRERPSTLGLVLLVDARVWLAYNSGQMADAEAAVRDTQTARAVLPNSSLVGLLAVNARLIAITAYEAAGDGASRDRALAEGRREIESLRGAPDDIKVIGARWHATRYFDGLNPRTEFDLPPTDPASPTADIAIFIRAYNHRLFGRADAAREAAAAEGAGLSTLGLRPILALDRPDGLAAGRQLWKEMKLKNWDPAPTVYGTAYTVLYGDAQDIAQTAERVRRPVRPYLLFPSGDRELVRAYLLGEISDEQFLAEPSSSRIWQGWRYFLIGLRHLRAGDREAARKAFRAAYDVKAYTFLYWELSILFLVLMDREPDWPAALPAKK